VLALLLVVPVALGFGDEEQATSATAASASVFKDRMRAMVIDHGPGARQPRAIARPTCSPSA
jgi:hypothetical protein